MSKNEYKIPKGYKGISSKINLKFNTSLAVITGVNGCGKSTMLKYLYENYPDRSKCFIKIPQTSSYHNTTRDRFGISRRVDRNSNEITFDNVMEDVERLGMNNRRKRIETPFSDKTDFYSALFDTDSITYDNGYEYLTSIAKLLYEYQLDDLDSIMYELGLVTDNQVETKLIQELNKTKVQNLTDFGVKAGKRIVEKFNNNLYEGEKPIRLIKKKKDEIFQILKKELRLKANVSSEQSLRQYVYELITREFRSIESVVQKMSNKIYQNFKTKSPRQEKLWEKINNELKKYNDKGYFKYKLVQPRLYETSYEIAFEHYESPTKSSIHFDSLSSGEKIIFELICYYFAASDSKLEMIMLDEFDANLNPQLAERYIEVIKEQFKNIKVVLTTHSPSTVVEVEPNELYELSLSHELTCAENEDGKKKILQRLAPKFVYHGEFGILEDVFNQKYDVIVFLEGKNDVVNFEKGLDNEKYKFIDSCGVGNMPDVVKIFKVIPFFKELAKQKKIMFLYDFDNEGIDKLSESLPRSANKQEIYNSIQKKEPYIKKVQDDLELYVSHLVPSQNHSWEIKNEYRHQELKKENEEGIKRQFAHIKNILQTEIIQLTE